MSQRSRVRIPYKPEFFSGFLFPTVKVAYITAMIILHLSVFVFVVVVVLFFFFYETCAGVSRNERKRAEL